jgi:hypothetical protein
MDFVCFVLFLVFYYIRPQEWYGFLATLRPIQLLSFFSVASILFRDKGVQPRDLLRTPLDWLMWAYFAWTIFTNQAPLDTAKSIQSVILCYALGIVALNSFVRIEKLLQWWAGCMMFIAALALLSLVGFDPLLSYDRTMVQMKGRLAINLSIFSNPNALAHSVVPVIPMIYYLLFWKRTFMRVWILLLAIPIQCVLLTQSKGAFVSGFATIAATLMFGRAKWTQAIIGFVVFTSGVTALYSLPRMGELSKTKNDDAIQGRVAAYTFGLQCIETYPKGIGLSNFQKRFYEDGPLEYFTKARTIHGRWFKEVKARHFYKATHSAYNQNGAELGYTGLYLFVGLLYASARTLIMAKTKSVVEERVRRVLFCILVSYAISSWMVDFCYRGSFFAMIAAISSFHRSLIDREAKKKEEEEGGEAATEERLPWKRPRTLPPIPTPALASEATLPVESPPGCDLPVPASASGPPVALARAPLARLIGRPVEGEEDEGPKGSAAWRRLTLVDFALMYVGLYLVMRMWRHIISTY